MSWSIPRQQQSENAPTGLQEELFDRVALHPDDDGSLRLALPAAHAADQVARGWGAPHPWAGTRLAAGFVMLFGPRTTDELDIVGAAHAIATSPVPTEATPG